MTTTKKKKVQKASARDLERAVKTYTRSAEVRQKMSDSQKRRWAKAHGYAK